MMQFQLHINSYLMELLRKIGKFMKLTTEEEISLTEWLQGCYHVCDTVVDGMFDYMTPCKKCGEEKDIIPLDFNDELVIWKLIKKLDHLEITTIADDDKDDDTCPFWARANEGDFYGGWSKQEAICRAILILCRKET
jgi:hypothetical protein